MADPDCFQTSTVCVMQVDVIDAELLKPWERKRQEYKQRKKVREFPVGLP